MALERPLHEAEACRLVAGSGDVALEHLAFMVDRSPKVDHLAVQLHVQVPAPVVEAEHVADPLTANVAGEQRTKPVPPKRYRLMAGVNPALEQQVLHVLSDKGKRTNISTTIGSSQATS